MKKTVFIINMLVANLAFAAEGVLEINHICASVLGCFNGDSAGYPINIDGSVGRSYRLTSDLVIPDENTDGIVITTPGISIDLNGFEIVRSACFGATTNCLLSGTGSGINVSTTNRGLSSSNYHGVSISNGSITGMGQHGVYLTGTTSLVKNLRLRWNGASGIFSSNNSQTLTDNIVFSNGTYGIFANSSSGALIKNNVIYNNTSHGIWAYRGSTLEANIVYGNSDGIRVDRGSKVMRNTVYANSGTGIRANAGSSVYDNTVYGNSGFGLDLDSAAVYRGNVLHSNGNNSANGQVNSGFNMSGNFCVNTICP